MSTQSPIDELDTSAGHAALSDALRSSFRMLRWFMLLLVGGYLLSGMFVVQQHEKAFVLTYGKVQGQGEDRIKGPGMHWTFPRPFSEVVKIPTLRAQEVVSDSFWFEMKETDDGPKAVNQGQTLRPGLDGYALTADANIVHSRWSFQFVVRDPEAYYFSFHDPDLLLHRLFDASVVHAFSRLTLDQALRSDVSGLIAEVKARFERSCDALRLGVNVESVKILNIIPPLQVFDAMNEVNRMESEAGTKLSQAREYAETKVTGAKGEAERIEREGETAKEELLAEIKADVAYFEKILERFESNPEVMQQSLRHDALKRALKKVKTLNLVHSKSGGQRTIVIDAGKELKIPGVNDE